MCPQHRAAVSYPVLPYVRIALGWLEKVTGGRMAMDEFSNDRRRARWLGALGIAACLTLAHVPAARAQDGAITAGTLVERAKIEDLLTRYYYGLGHGSADSFSAFYADDAELILGPNSYRGKQGIEDAYKSAGQDTS